LKKKSRYHEREYYLKEKLGYAVAVWLETAMLLLMQSEMVVMSGGAGRVRWCSLFFVGMYRGHSFALNLVLGHHFHSDLNLAFALHREAYYS